MSSATRIEVQPMTEPDDAEDLVLMLAKVSGRIVNVQRLFADELEIAIAPVATEADPHEAQWLIGTQGSRWQLTSAAGTVEADGDSRGESVDAMLAQLVGTGVVSLEPELPTLDLVLRLSNGRSISIEGMTDQADEDLGYPEPPFWEVFTPDGHVIAAGPGPYWSRSPANVAERDVAKPLQAFQINRDFVLWQSRRHRLVFLFWLEVMTTAAALLLAGGSFGVAVTGRGHPGWLVGLLLGVGAILSCLVALAILTRQLSEQLRWRNASLAPEERHARRLPRA